MKNLKFYHILENKRQLDYKKLHIYRIFYKLIITFFEAILFQ